MNYLIPRLGLYIIWKVFFCFFSSHAWKSISAVFMYNHDGTGLPLYDVALVEHGFLRLTKVSVSAESIRIWKLSLWAPASTQAKFWSPTLQRRQKVWKIGGAFVLRLQRVVGATMVHLFLTGKNCGCFSTPRNPQFRRPCTTQYYGVQQTTMPGADPCAIFTHFP